MEAIFQKNEELASKLLTDDYVMLYNYILIIDRGLCNII